MDGSHDNARFNSPKDLVIDTDPPQIYVADEHNNRIRRVRFLNDISADTKHPTPIASPPPVISVVTPSNTHKLIPAPISTLPLIGTSEVKTKQPTSENITFPLTDNMNAAGGLTPAIITPAVEMKQIQSDIKVNEVIRLGRVVHIGGM